MNELFADIVVKANKAQAKGRDLHNKLVSIFSLLLLNLRDQLQFFYIVFKAKGNCEVPNHWLISLVLNVNLLWLQIGLNIFEIYLFTN